jgi:hypothetical protein
MQFFVSCLQAPDAPGANSSHRAIVGTSTNSSGCGVDVGGGGGGGGSGGGGGGARSQGAPPTTYVGAAATMESSTCATVEESGSGRHDNVSVRSHGSARDNGCESVAGSREVRCENNYSLPTSLRQQDGGRMGRAEGDNVDDASARGSGGCGGDGSAPGGHPHAPSHSTTYVETYSLTSSVVEEEETPTQVDSSLLAKYAKNLVALRERARLLCAFQHVPTWDTVEKLLYQACPQLPSRSSPQRFCFCLFVCLFACLFVCRRYTQVDASRTQALQQALSAHRRRPSDDQPTALEESSPEPSPVSQPTSPTGSAVGDSNLTSHLSDDIDELLAEVTAEQRKLRKSKLPPVTIISEV